MAQRRTGSGALVPLTGVLFVVLAAASFLISGEPPDPDDPRGEIVEWWSDHEGQAIFGALLEAFAAVALLFFSAVLRRVLRRSEDGSGVLSVAAMAGGIVLAAGIGVDASIRFALGDLADDVGGGVIVTLNAYWSRFFFPMVIGAATLLLAVGLSALRSRVIPVWLAWAGIVIALALFTPIGFPAFLVSLLWFLVVSILLWRQEAGSSATPTGALA